MKKHLSVASAFVVGLLPAIGFCDSAFSVDKSRGEWTLFVIPDTQGYVEDWREEGYLYEEMVETFKWLNEVASDMNVQLVQSVGDIIVDSGKAVVCKHTDETFSVKRTVLIKSPENCAGGAVRSQYSSSLISLGFSTLPSFSIRG